MTAADHVEPPSEHVKAAVRDAVARRTRRIFEGFAEIHGAPIPGRHSQLCQDLFVLTQTGFKRDGYFVEFGATNGVKYSNTLSLERQYGWRGILSEPATAWSKQLRANRRAIIDTRCVWARTGETLMFSEPKNALRSTIQEYSGVDRKPNRHDNAPTRAVTTVSLLDLLLEHNAPENIDYLSIDTEGSEFEILQAFDFNRFRLGVITCEHAFVDDKRVKIYDLLTRNGYRRVFKSISRFDDWYISDEALDILAKRRN